MQKIFLMKLLVVAMLMTPLSALAQSGGSGGDSGGSAGGSTGGASAGGGAASGPTVGTGSAAGSPNAAVVFDVPGHIGV
jgi:hypothetical protein